MTCTSLRSGSASSGVLATAHTPAAIAAALKSRTRSRLPADQLMIFVSTGLLRLFWRGDVHPGHVAHAAQQRAEVRFGIQEERGGFHDGVSLSKTAHDLDAIVRGDAH